ncbi:hypothetical protein Plec18167_002789 [Paecilomyces lecythidis]|uniref:Intradiol ring-cleavage dioxygenases domain-containing protein n=1 Tax=Paecilomyces lecythidis TaxID=3004212 RepID=A0ABR3Y3G1_9EURO
MTSDTRWCFSPTFLGISALVNAISYQHKPGATESSVLGPFHDENSHLIGNGATIVEEGTYGEATLVRGKVRSVTGAPVKQAFLDVWETDGHGVYDLEYVDRHGDPNRRGKLYTDDEGQYAFTCVRPILRPAHMHFMILHPEYNKLITALYSRDSKYVESDTVFGVKSSLLVDYKFTKDTELAGEYGMQTFKKNIDGKQREGGASAAQDSRLDQEA